MNMQQIARALQFIARAQQADGSFKVIAKPRTAEASTTVSLNMHALLLDLLCLVDDERAKAVAAPLAAYLMTQISSNAFHTVDTQALFHTLAALHTYDAALITPELAAAAVHFLVQHEITVGGPYLGAMQSTNMPDVSVNASIYRFVRQVGRPLPKLEQFLQEAKATPSTYYAAPWPLALEVGQRTLIDKLPHLSQQPNGSFATTYICIDPHMPGISFGSPALSTAAMLAAHLPAAPTPPKATLTNKSMQEAQRRARLLPPAVAEPMRQMLERVAQADTKQEISQLAVRFAKDLHGMAVAPAQTMHLLGAANLFNWAAYTLYDNFLDDDGRPADLPTANAALRLAVALFTTAVPVEDFKTLTAKTFNTVDAANAWELAHCRFLVSDSYITIGSLPKYGKLRALYERSLTHSLPVLGALAAAGAPLQSPATANVQTAFEQYIILRQLNDDALDWQEDFAAGHISYVVSEVLRAARVRPGRYMRSELLPRLERAFARHIVPALAQRADRHLQAILHHLTQSGVVQAQNVIADLARSAAQTLTQLSVNQRQSERFLDAYRSSVQQTKT